MRTEIPELTWRVFILAIILTVLLAMSNAYLALRLGILTSASIPAAIISMGILRFFKNATILENNAVQTAASAGEAVAGGIVYTIPALIMIRYWDGFDYATNFFIAAIGGTLGVLFSIPLRRILVHDPALKFPEGRAIAEVLKSSIYQIGLKNILLGGIIGALLELLQVGLKVVANSWNYWLVVHRSIVGFGVGFSSTMIGAGFLIGFEMAFSIFVGAVLSWLIGLPIASQFFPEFLSEHSVAEGAIALWNSHMRYFGIGAMLFAAMWTLAQLIKPLLNSISLSWHDFKHKESDIPIPRAERDIPMLYIIIGIFLLSVVLFLFFQFIFPMDAIELDSRYAPSLVFFAVMYVLIVGFLFSVTTAYFSGMVGVTASPGSSIVIAGILFAAWILLSVMNWLIPLPFDKEQIQAAEAIIIIIGSVVTGIAAIANDNTQDLKVGQLVGATPWRQQLMLLLGVLVSALVIPPVMQLLYNVYGIAGVMPREGMDISQSLPAPTSALLAAITEGVFQHALPWTMMFIGAGVILVIILLNRICGLHKVMRLSILGIAIGMYLPISSSIPLFLGGLIAWFVNYRLSKTSWTMEEKNHRKQIGTLIACGLVAGSAIMDVLLAIPFSLFRSPEALSIVSNAWKPYGTALGAVSIFFLALWIERRMCK